MVSLVQGSLETEDKSWRFVAVDSGRKGTLKDSVSVLQDEEYVLYICVCLI